LDSSGIPPLALLSIAEAPPFVPVISVVGLALLILPDVEPIGWFQEIQANEFLCTTDFDSNIAVMQSAAIVSGYSGIRIWNLVQMACAVSWECSNNPRKFFDLDSGPMSGYFMSVSLVQHSTRSELLDVAARAVIQGHQS
jgi:hypothetical protein